MNINDANLILDRHKEGTHVYSMLTITRALYITGDIQQEPESFGSDGKKPGWKEHAWMRAKQLDADTSGLFKGIKDDLVKEMK